MKIRAITIGGEQSVTLNTCMITDGARVAMQLAKACEDEGIAVQTVRFATQPFPQYLSACTEKELVQFALELQHCCQDHVIDYCSLGPVNLYDPHEASLLAYLPRLIAETESVFASAILGESARSISVQSAQAIARVIAQIAQATDGGFGN
jgi:uncharacterized protein (UPF0210 family)